MTPPDDDVRRWARTVLGMSAGDDARFALLRQVRATQFITMADLGAAFRVCAEPGGIFSGDAARALESAGYVHDREQRRRHMLDAFADGFFWALQPARTSRSASGR